MESTESKGRFWDVSRRSVSSSVRAVRRAAPFLARSIDFHLGVAAAIGAYVAASLRDELVAEIGVELAVASGALGIAIVAVALTALAILAGLMTDAFAQVLQSVDGGVEGTFMPYQATAMLGGLATLGGFACLAAGPVASHDVLVVGFALMVGLDVWMVVATCQLVTQTADIGRQRARLFQGMTEAQRRADDLRSRSK